MVEMLAQSVQAPDFFVSHVSVGSLLPDSLQWVAVLGRVSDPLQSVPPAACSRPQTRVVVGLRQWRAMGIHRGHGCSTTVEECTPCEAH